MHLVAEVLTLLAMLAAEQSAAPAAARPPDFKTDVQPILSRCTPCHFEGGVMYEKLPFDRGETVVKLGDKLFSRIKDEKERAVIRRFIATRTHPRSPAREAAPSSG